MNSIRKMFLMLRHVANDSNASHPQDDRSHLYIVMEYCNGGDLSKYMKSKVIHYRSGVWKKHFCSDYYLLLNNMSTFIATSAHESCNCVIRI